MFTCILIANRGEIACRVMRTAHRLGIRTVAVYHPVDQCALHVDMADEAVCLPGLEPRAAYLDIPGVIEAARQSGAQAIHPGYGFLSENAEFAEACAAAGLVFIGPPAAAMRAMGEKCGAKALMAGSQVPVLPGYHGDDQGDDSLLAQARLVGFPLLIKASAGGGGKGMRVVNAEGEFLPALHSCRREALASFGDERVLLERYLPSCRHVEVQVFADQHGHCVYLFDRDCSAQRRHQKVLEEAPAPGLPPALAAAMGQAAVAAAQAVGYVGAGTVEFLLAPDGAFYFMEMNTRLQVEHPVTEMITGQDLVAWQLQVAAGGLLPLSQAELSLQGHAVEVRLYAEDPARDFLPAPGHLSHLRFPADEPHLRVETGVREGDDISPHFDPMIAKLVVWGADREAAFARLSRLLAATELGGLGNNLDFLQRLAACADMRQARLDTALIERNRAELLPLPEPAPLEALAAAACAVLLDEPPAQPSDDPHSPWRARDGWRLGGYLSRRLEFSQRGEPRPVQVAYRPQGWRLQLYGTVLEAEAHWLAPGRLNLQLGARRVRVGVARQGNSLEVFLAGQCWAFEWHDPLTAHGSAAQAASELVAPMPGRVLAWLAAPGQQLAAGEPLLVLEAMKMEHTLRAPCAGLLHAFLVPAGAQVQAGQQLVDFAPEGEA